MKRIIFVPDNLNKMCNTIVCRLERLLAEQIRVLSRLQDPPSLPSCQTIATVDLGEHILALRLHGCFMRLHRVLGSNMNPSMLRSTTSERRGAAVTQDGTVRYFKIINI